MLFILVFKEDLIGPWTFYDISTSGVFYLFICVNSYTQTMTTIRTIKPDLLLFDPLTKETPQLYDRLRTLAGLENIPAIGLSKEDVEGELAQQLQDRQITILKQPYGQQRLLQTIKDICQPGN